MFDLTRFRRVPATTVDDDLVLDGQGRGVDDPVQLLLEELRAETDTAVEPTAALQAVLSGGLRSDREAAPAATPVAQRPLRRLAYKLAGLSLAAQIGVGAAAASAATVGAASVNALPRPVQDLVAGWVERVSPLDLPDSADFGQRVSQDARDDSPGVEGPSIADERTSQAPPATDQGSRGQGTRPEPPDRLNHPERPDQARADRPGFAPLTPYQLWRPYTPSPAPDVEDHASDHPSGPSASDPSNRPSTPASESGERSTP